MHSHADHPPRVPLRQSDDLILRGLLHPSKVYLIFVTIMGLCALAGILAYSRVIFVAIGVTGLNDPVHWGFFIILFVFWVGVAHSGTLISAILYLFKAEWRTSINRVAEAMTVSSLFVAGLFPLVHLGRVWRFYYLVPYPSSRLLWPNFRSPLVWDMTAVFAYLAVSIVFFYTGLLPDLATVRDRSTGIVKDLYGAMAMRWRGSNLQWHHYKMALLLLSGLATALVISVSSVVSWDFSAAMVPGWHDEIYAPEFVTGALFSGFAMLIVILVPLRKFSGFEDLITQKHFDMICKMMIVMSLLLTYMYCSEFFTAYYSAEVFERFTYYDWAFGIYRQWFWIMILFNSILPLTLFYAPLRHKLPYTFVVAILGVIGMWLERFVIIASSLSRDYDPYIWRSYTPTYIEVAILVGSFGIFFVAVALLGKVFPTVALAEVKSEIRGKISEITHG